MGVTVREKRKGSEVWWIFIREGKKRTSRRIGEKRLAEKVAKQLRAKITLGQLDMIEKKEDEVKIETPSIVIPTFKEYALYWLADYIKGLRRDSTYERYKGILERNIFPVIGKKAIDQVKRADVKGLLLKHHKEGRSRSCISLCRDVLSGIMNHAVDDELITANPVNGVLKMLRLERRQTVIVPFNQHEVDKILATCKQQYPQWYVFFLAAFDTGMRLGELSGLRWDDIDWKRKLIRVERSNKNGHVSPTKNGKVRWVEMSNVLLVALEGILSGLACSGRGKGEVEAAGIIFERNERSLHQNSVRGAWRRLLRKANVKYRRFHDIRHTYASLLLSQGQSLFYVKEQMGHSSIQITVDTYGHWIPSEKREVG
ncbi:tyrosine recombinase XerC [Gemmatimonadota bacterium]